MNLLCCLILYALAFVLDECRMIYGETKAAARDLGMTDDRGKPVHS